MFEEQRSIDIWAGREKGLEMDKGSRVRSAVEVITNFFQSFYQANDKQ